MQSHSSAAHKGPKRWTHYWYMRSSSAQRSSSRAGSSATSSPATKNPPAAPATPAPPKKAPNPTRRRTHPRLHDPHLRRPTSGSANAALPQVTEKLGDARQSSGDRNLQGPACLVPNFDPPFRRYREVIRCSPRIPVAFNESVLSESGIVMGDAIGYEHSIPIRI